MAATPELHDEVVRKAYETIERLETDRVSGRITSAQFGYGVDILWSAVAGLVDGEFMTAVELLNAHRKEAVTKLVFMHDETGAIVRVINDHKGSLTYTAFAHGKNKNAQNRVFDFTQEHQPLVHVKEKIAGIAKALHAKGFSLL
ncbi:hypothetical protein [Castellaniella sp.]|uniref:hypothetical protein n=1 Tax=Castellaniella sp. TaxID=1955812 RepID=UPI002AFF6405|nr:hypothetical protein [Castellaniella sp.]